MSKRDPSGRRLERVALVLLLTVVWAKGVLWSIAVPLWRGIDETVHFATVQFIAEHGRLPGPGDVYRSDEIVQASELTDIARLPFRPTQRQTFAAGHLGPREQESRELDPLLRTSYESQAPNSAAHAPPLYHILAAGVYRLVYHQDVFTRAFAVRQFSVLLGVLTVWLVYLAVHELFPPDPSTPQGTRAGPTFRVGADLGALPSTGLETGRTDPFGLPHTLMRLSVPLLVGFQPMFTFLTATVNSDTPLLVVYALIIYLLVRAVRRGLRYGLAAAIGAVMGIGMLIKPLVVTVVPPIGYLLALEFCRNRGRDDRAPIGRLATMLGLMVVCALLVSSWSLARNMRVSGNPFYLIDPNIASRTPDPELQRYPLDQYIVNHSISLIEGLFVSYWADFGTLDTPLAPIYYLVIRWVVIAAAIGVGRHLWREGRVRWRELLLLILLVAFHIIMLDAYDYYFWRSYGVGAVGQGKYYLYPAVAQFTLLALGIASLLPGRLRSVGLGVLCLGMIGLHFVSLLGYLLPRYYL